jgi:hypothetical protein
VAGLHEHRKECSGFIKGGELFHCLIVSLARMTSIEHDRHMFCMMGCLNCILEDLC